MLALLLTGKSSPSEERFRLPRCKEHLDACEAPPFWGFWFLDLADGSIMLLELSDFAHELLALSPQPFDPYADRHIECLAEGTVLPIPTGVCAVLQLPPKPLGLRCAPFSHLIKPLA